MSADAYPYLAVGDQITANTTAGGVHGEIVTLDRARGGELRSLSIREPNRDDLVHVHWSTVTMWRLGEPAVQAAAISGLAIPAGLQLRAGPNGGR